MRAGHLGDPSFLLAYGRPGGDIAEILLDLFFRCIEIDVARQRQHGIRRPVVGLEPVLHVVHRRRVEVFHGADHGPRVRMAGRIGILGDELLGNVVGLVLALALFILDDAALQIQRLLVERTEQVAHAVGLQPEGVIQGGDGHVLKVVGAVAVGGAIQVGGAHPLHGVDVAAVEVFTAAKHQVLEQVREAGLAGLLVLGPHVIPDVHRHDRGFVVFVDDDGEAVVQHEFPIRDVDAGGLGQGGRAQQKRWEKRFQHIDCIPSYASPLRSARVHVGFEGWNHAAARS